jgi:hypothetical protein
MAGKVKPFFLAAPGARCRHLIVIYLDLKIIIDRGKREWIDRLLLEGISLAGIARAGQVGEQWLLSLPQGKIP